jgi:hypothetical protein
MSALTTHTQSLNKEKRKEKKRNKEMPTSWYKCNAKCTTQRKLYICYKGAPTTNSRNQTHTMFSPQMSACSLIEGLGEDIC